MVKILSFLRLATITCVILSLPVHLSACMCKGAYGKNALERSAREAQFAAVIFEGTLERSELRWNVWNAKDGELTPTEIASESGYDWPRMRLTFRVQRGYKGDLGPEVQMTTGMGGGDCGAIFSSGLTYLIYGGQHGPDGLDVSMCSPGGWIEDSGVATELRYLRKERPIANDLQSSRPSQQQQRSDFEENQKRYAAATGIMCGTVIAEKTKDASDEIAFLSITGSSPIQYPTAKIEPDGSFCSEHLGPGRYYLYFSRRSNRELKSSVYYPGVGYRSRATPVEIKAGQRSSGIVFRIPVQETHSVRGFISTNDKNGLAGGVSVRLVNLEAPLRTWYGQQIDFGGFFPFPKTKYFDFGNVLPGHYMAYAPGLGRDWSTTKVNVDVAGHMKFILLDFLHKK